MRSRTFPGIGANADDRDSGAGPGGKLASGDSWDISDDVAPDHKGVAAASIEGVYTLAADEDPGMGDDKRGKE